MQQSPSTPQIQAEDVVMSIRLGTTWTGIGWAPIWVLASVGQGIHPIGEELRNLEHIHGFSEG